MNKLYNDTAVQAIANAIRAKNGSSDTYTIAEMSTALNDISYYAKSTISNVALATFEADGLPLNSLKVSVEAQQASGTPSPSNPLPISGWDAVVVTDTEINVWDEVWDLGGIDPSTGQDVSGNLVRSKNYIAVSADTTYYFKGIGRVFYYDNQKNYISRLDRNNNAFTTPNNCKYIRFRMDTSYGSTYNNDVSINYPSTDTSYHAYNGVTTTISLGQTVYGGEVDVVNGTSGNKVTHVYVEFDGSADEVWTIAPEDATAKIIGSAPGSKQVTTSVMSNYFESPSTDPWNNVDAIWTRYGQLHVNPDSSIIPSGITSEGLAEWRTWLSTHPLQVRYELATPTTFTTQPTLIKSLNGTNNLSVDSGVVIELEYFKEV